MNKHLFVGVLKQKYVNCKRCGRSTAMVGETDQSRHLASKVRLIQQALLNKLYSLEAVNGIIQDIKKNGTIASDDAIERIWKPIIATEPNTYK